MEYYHKFMQFFWLVLALFIFSGVTYMGIQEGFEQWYFNYTFGALALLMFFMRRLMYRRMKKHQAFLDGKENEEK